MVNFMVPFILKFLSNTLYRLKERVVPMLYRLNRWTSSEIACCYITNITGSIWRWRGAKLAGCTATVHDDLAQDAGGYSNPANIAHGMLLGVDYLRSSCENSGHIFRTGEVLVERGSV